MKRFILVAASLVLVAGLAFASGGSGEGTGAASTATAGGLPLVKEPITLKVLTNDWAGIVVGPEMPVAKEISKRTNVKFDVQLLPLTGTLDKLNLIMASGDLPDLLGYGNADIINKFGPQGAFIPVQDLIAKYGPDIKKSLDNPLPNDKLPYKINAWAEITASDGNIYTIPGISSSNAIGAVWGIRIDWLAKLGLATPDTLDDLYKAFVAFKTKDPNGNGKADEIPFIAAQGGQAGYVLPMVAAFGAHMSLYRAQDGSIKYGPVEEKYREAIQWLAKIYKEGLLDPDYLTTTRDQWLSKITSSIGGFQYGWPASGYATPNAALQKVNPEYKLMPISPVKGPYGDRYKDTASAGNFIFYRNAITSKNKYPEVTMRLLNYCYTDEGTLLISYGIEGLHYDMVNGKPVYRTIITQNPDGLDPEIARIRDGVDITYLPYQIGWDSHFQAMGRAAPWTVKAWESYRDPGMVEAPMPTLQYTAEELAVINNIRSEINTYQAEMVNKFIMGTEPLANFDQYVARIKKANLDQWLKIANDALARYGKGNKK